MSVTPGRRSSVGISGFRTLGYNLIVLVAVLGALLVWGGREAQAPWGETQGPAFSQAQIAQWSDEMVAQQVTALGCSTTPALTETVAVRNAVGFDRGVVRTVSFDEAVSLAKAGKVYIEGWCA